MYNFLGDNQTWFNYGDAEGPMKLETFVNSFAIFRDRVRRLFTTKGVVFLMLAPLNYVDATGEQMDGMPYVWDELDNLQLHECPDDFRVFHMYYGDKESGKVSHADCVEIDAFVTETDFDMHFREQLKTQDFDAIMRTYGAVVAARQSSAAPDMC